MNLSDYIHIEKKNGVATVWLDQKGEKINKVSPEVIGLFEEVMRLINEDNQVIAVVLASMKKDFIAGADIESFQQVQQPGDFAPISRKGHEILNAIENSKKPVVAAIQGACMGAGLEVALACAGRIAADHKSTKLALPEVKLGLLPGGGGTQRLPRLVGIQNALDMMLTGKNIYARKAYKIGLVDEVVHPNKLIGAAKELALKLVGSPLKRKDKRPLQQKLLESNSVSRKVLYAQARKMVKGMTKGNYPAPFKIIDCVETGMEKGKKAGFEAEVNKFEELILSPESRQLIHIFFAMNTKKKNPYPDKVKEVDKLAMLGAGFMGAGITEVSINEGIEVILKDIKDETLSNAEQTIWKNYRSKIKKKIISEVEASQLMGRIHPQLSYKGFEQADIVIEAVFEDLNLKKKVIAEVEEVTRKDCIFASNTSALPISAIAEVSKRPELIIGMHYFSPVPKMPLLEIVKTKKTAEWVTATCYELGVRQGKTCIVVNDGPGFYTTRILAPYMNEALLILEEGGDILQLDAEMKKFGYPVGPITLMDEVGIDVGAHIMSGDLMKAYVESREGVKVSKAILHLNKAGFKGRKNNKGFLIYDAKTGKKKKGQVNKEAYEFFGGPQRKKFPSEQVQNRIAWTMINEAALCLQDGIIESPLDGDVGAIFGLGFPPFRGGPFRYMDSLGIDNCIKLLEDFTEKYGNRFKPAQILYDYVKEGKAFYE